jgi:hypothetical protein
VIYDELHRGALTFALGAQISSPIQSTGTLDRRNGGAFLIQLGADLGRRVQLSIDLALTGRSFDTGALRRELGADGSVGTLTSYTNGRTAAGLSGAGGLWSTLSFRWSPNDWTIRPYFGVLAGLRYEPLLFESADFQAACAGTAESDLFCGATRGYAIEAPTTGWTLGPLAGVRTALFYGEKTGLELRFEARGHATFWGRPKLRFDGEVTEESLRAYGRWSALEYGDPVFDLTTLALLELRFGIF